MASLVGKQIENYKIVEKLGEGGMGIVYRAIELGLDRDVAMKQIIPLQASDERFRKRFLDEARTAANLKHANIVPVHRLLPETEYGMFIVMEYVEGITLADYLKQKGAMPYRQALPVFKQLLSALAYAHQEKNVIHRDIKPGNIMLTKDGTPKLLDFGLAKIQHDDFDKTRTFHSVGTVSYMSPEQLDLDQLIHVDQRTDIYSLGMTLYELLVGKSPLDEVSSSYSTGGFAWINYLINYIRTRDFTPPDEVNPDIPSGVSKVVMKSLAKDPNRRFQSADEMKAAIENIEHERHEPKPNFFADLSAAMRDFAEYGKRTVHRLGSRLNWRGVVDFIETYRYPILFGTMAMAALIVLVGIIIPPINGNGSGNGDDSKLVSATVTIEVTPRDALVEIDEKVIDNLQLQQLSLSPGRHEIYISRDGYKPIWDEFELVPGVNEPLNYSLEKEAPKVDTIPAVITFVVSPKNAQLKVGDTNYAPNKRTDVELEPGNYRIVASAKNHDTKVLDLHFRPGEERTIRIDLETIGRRVVDLKVTTKPPGALIYIGDKLKGTTTDNGLIIPSLTIGFHNIRATKEGYQDCLYQYEVNQQKTNYFYCELKPKNIVTVAAVEESGKPVPLARIYVNGDYRGTTPKELLLDDGTYNFELRHDGYATFISKSVPISNNKKLECLLRKK